MVLKRKRSESEISSSSSLLSSPLSASGYMSIDSSGPSIPAPFLSTSRTRKRYRNNRPSESVVHQHTLSLLFSAQQHPSTQSKPSTNLHSFEMDAQTSGSSIPSHQSSQQTSLHSFWALPNSARNPSPSSHSSISSSASITNPANDALFQATNCEDCNASLISTDNGDSMDVDVMMGIDSLDGNRGCSKCGKQVCYSCSISNLGADRICLICARPKRWQGGIGWVDM